jgi:hypothetical protein
MNLYWILVWLFTQTQGLSGLDLEFDQLSIEEIPSNITHSDTVKLIGKEGSSFIVSVALLDQSKVLKTQMQHRWGRPSEIPLPIDDNTLEWVTELLMTY